MDLGHREVGFPLNSVCKLEGEETARLLFGLLGLGGGGGYLHENTTSQWCPLGICETTTLEKLLREINGKHYHDVSV